MATLMPATEPWIGAEQWAVRYLWNRGHSPIGTAVPRAIAPATGIAQPAADDTMCAAKQVYYRGGVTLAGGRRRNRCGPAALRDCPGRVPKIAQVCLACGLHTPNCHAFVRANHLATRPRSTGVVVRAGAAAAGALVWQRRFAVARECGTGCAFSPASTRLMPFRRD